MSRCLALFAILLAACADDAPGTSALVRDSAGVQVVHSQAPAWGAGAGWRVAEEPKLSIGVVDGDTEYQLFQVYSAIRLTDGRIVVGNSGSSELRFFDASGHHLLSVGGWGEGPGEFHFVSRVWPTTGDSLLVWDTGIKRASVFTTDGEFVRSITLERTADVSRPNAIGSMADGTLVSSSSRGLPLTEELVGQVVQASIAFGRYDASGIFLNKLGNLPGRRRYVVSTTGSVRWPFLPFSPSPAWAVYGDNVYLGSGETPMIAVTDRDGATVQSIRWDARERKVTRDDIERYATQLRENARDQNQLAGWNRFLDEAPFPDRFPVYQSLLVDTEGQLWVEEYMVPGESHPTWSVFDAEGRWLGRVETPPGVEVLHISKDALLGRWRDSIDVEHIQLYDLIKSGR